MEEHDMNNMDQNTSEEQMVITREGESYLNKTAGWAIFLSVMCFVYVASELFSGIVYAIKGDVATLLISVFASALYVAPAIFLMLFAIRSKNAIGARNQESFSSSLLNFKHFWKYYGIWQIVSVSLGVLITIVAIVALCIFF